MGIIDTAKNVYDLLGKGANLELQEQVLKLREEAIEIQNESLTMQQRIEELEEDAASLAAMEFDGLAYWKSTADDEKREGPFCQRCFDRDRKIVRLLDRRFTIKFGDDVTRANNYKCTVCNINFDYVIEDRNGLCDDGE